MPPPNLPSSPRRKASPGSTGLLVAAGIAGGFLAGVAFTQHPTSTWSLLLSGAPEHRLVPTTTSGGAAGDRAGWKTLHVFYGTADHLAGASAVPVKAKAALESQVYFGEVGQDELVTKLFRKKRGGYFLDMAANDAVVGSNTYGLEKSLGWTGVCVEAGSKYWLGLAHRACHVVAAVVGNDREDVTFVHRTKAGLSGIMGDGFDNKVVQQGTAQTRRTVTLVEVLQRFDAPKVIDYFSLDVEGAEEMVLQPAVLLQYRFNLITIERPKQALKDLLATNGYVFLKQIAGYGETLWAHSLALPELDLAGAGIEKPSAQAQ
jgi:Methyltransferase FkbM domain